LQLHCCAIDAAQGRRTITLARAPDLAVASDYTARSYRGGGSGH
jgi:hypothetical protein